MRMLVSVSAGSLAALFAVQAAASVSITNRDAKDHKVTVIEGDAKKEHVLKPTSMVDGICEKGCVVRLNDSDNDEYELDGTEVVSIEDGYLYYDGPDVPVETGKDPTPPAAQGKDPAPKQ